VGEAGAVEPARKLVDHVVLDQLEPAAVAVMPDILDPSGLKIVEANDPAALAEQPIAQVRADEASAPCYQRDLG